MVKWRKAGKTGQFLSFISPARKDDTWLNFNQWKTQNLNRVNLSQRSASLQIINQLQLCRHHTITTPGKVNSDKQHSASDLITAHKYRLVEQGKGVNILQEFESKDNWFVLTSFITK